MKKIIHSAVMTCLGASLLLTGSCSKDKYKAPTPSIPTSTEQVLSSQGNTGLTYQSGTLPSSTSSGTTPSILGITNNDNAITGGANQLTISLSDPDNNVTKVIYGIKGLPGYYTQTVPSGTSTVDLNVFINQIHNEGHFVLTVALVDASGNVSAYKELPIKLLTVGTGKLQISLTWDQLNDLDLHLILPSGNEIFYGDPNGLGNVNNPNYSTTGVTTGSLLDLDSNPGCEIDSVNNENITFAQTIPLEVGIYKVRVDNYQDCNGLATTNYVATVRLNGNFLHPLTGANPAIGNFAPNTDDSGDYDAGVTVMTFEVTSANGRYAIQAPSYTSSKRTASATDKKNITTLSKLKKIGQ